VSAAPLAPAPVGSIADATLLEAALVMFAARGFEATSVREIARSQGVSHNFIPQRFGSKERLWYAAVDHGFERVAADLAAVPLDPEADDVERLREVVVEFVVSMGSRPALLQIISQEATTPGARLEYLFDHYIEPVRRLGDAVLAPLGAEGRLRSMSVSLMYFMMTHGAGGAFALPALAELFGDAVDPTDADAVRRHAEEAVDVLFHGLARDPRRDP